MAGTTERAPAAGALAGTNGEGAGEFRMRVVFWGTYDLGKPRTRILLRGLRENGVEVVECHADVWAGVEDKTRLKGWRNRLRVGAKWVGAYPALILRYLRSPPHDAVVVGFPGYLDVLIIRVFAWLRGAPVLWDVFMSLYGTVVEDRALVDRRHLLARFLFFWEWLACRAVTALFLDTRAHADYFISRYGIARGRVFHVFVGAEPEAFPARPDGEGHAVAGNRETVLFYGQFIPLQGTETIAKAALTPEGARRNWVLIGTGQDASAVRSLLDGAPAGNVEWIPWVDYDQLKKQIYRADVCLGIFGATDKASRVIPNKVYQALSAGVPLVTRDSPAIRELLDEGMDGVYLVPPADPAALNAALNRFSRDREKLYGRALHRTVAARITPQAVGGVLSEGVTRVVKQTGV